MESTFTNTPLDTFRSQPKPDQTAVSFRSESTVSQAPKLPMEILATSPFGDTDFRRKIGIERWGWGLND